MGKTVPTTAPGEAGPADLSAALARHRSGNDARPTRTAQPAPDRPDAPSTGTLTSGNPAPWSEANVFHPGLRTSY